MTETHPDGLIANATVPAVTAADGPAGPDGPVGPDGLNGTASPAGLIGPDGTASPAGTDGPDGTGTFEATFATAERQLDGALKAANATVRELKRALAAARTGQVRDLHKSLSAISAAAAGLARDTRSLNQGFDFDEKAYLASGAYTKELLAEAASRGLTVLEDGDRLLCYPSLLHLVPNDAAIDVDKVRERRLRPSVLVTALARARDRGPRFNAAAFLDSLREAYQLKVGGAGTERADAVIQLVEIWKVLTMQPGQRSQYSKQEFARDLYLLDQSGVTSTARSRRTLRWSASTGTKGTGTLVTVGRDGQQQRYWGVSFTIDEPDGAS